MRYQLGKHKPRHDFRTLRLENYLTDKLPAPLDHCGWTNHKQQWSMSLNDNIGDCVVACADHLIYLWTFFTQSSPKQISDAVTLKVYEAITGYDPKTGANDNGMAILDILKFWSKSGNLFGEMCGPYLQVNTAHHSQIMQTVRFFGGPLIGVNLPVNCQQDIGGGKTWHVRSTTGDGEPGSWGGHCVPIISYDKTGLICITWGAQQKMTWGFFDTYCDEAWAVLNKDWLNTTNSLTPNGFNWTQLCQDLQAVTQL